MKPPKPVDGLGYCPLIGQGCIGDQCALWVQVWGKADDQEPELRGDCTLNWQTVLAKEQLVETARVTAGHDKVATEAQHIAGAIALASQGRD